MNVDRKVYAERRVDRLNSKLNRINNYLHAISHSGHPNDVITRNQLNKAKRSTQTAINRWQKELSQI